MFDSKVRTPIEVLVEILLSDLRYAHRLGVPEVLVPEQVAQVNLDGKIYQVSIQEIK